VTTRPCAAALALLMGATLAGCAASRSHALEYVVLPNHEAQGGPEERVATPVPDPRQYPIYGDDPPPLAHELQARQAAGGAGCSVGLAGARCERGILAAEVPLEERELLPPDGRAIQTPLPGPGENAPIPPLPPAPRPEGPIPPGG
jgi:hypothetical protein